MDFTMILSSVVDCAAIYGVRVMIKKGTLQPNILIDLGKCDLGIVL